MATIQEMLNIGIYLVLAVVIFGAFMPLVNGSAVGSIVVTLVSIVPLAMAGRTILAIMSG